LVLVVRGVECLAGAVGEVREAWLMRLARSMTLGADEEAFELR
jgi:hypothetical protein